MGAAAAADATRLSAEAEADATRMRGDATAEAERARGGAVAASYLAGRTALGDASFTAIQIASIVGNAGLKLVPDVQLGDGRANLADVLLARMAATPAANTQAYGMPSANTPAAVGTPDGYVDLTTSTNGAHK